MPYLHQLPLFIARRPALQRRLHGLDRAAGALFIACGPKLAMSENPSR
jgi:hypothetical protein